MEIAESSYILVLD